MKTPEIKLEAPSFNGFSDTQTLENLDALFTAQSLLKKSVSTAPTYVPKTFYDSIVFYVNGGTYRVYFYLNPTAGWRYCALT